MQELEYIPTKLKSLKKEVKALFYKGDKTLLDKKIIAIVGSRRPNAYTKRVVTQLASSLSARDVYIISGGAMGVDALSHKGAYPKTIGVMANSLDIIYPKVNEKMIKDMEKNSLVLSEYEPQTKATPWSFVDRNRIVVALSDIVIIAQADIKSGSMHSAKIAQKLDKELYVLPQRIGESDGTNKLVAEGKAKVIYDIDLFCEQFGSVKRDDEVLEFCKKNPRLQTCLDRYGDTIYEYELDGKLQISGVHIRVLGE